jgi:hypothetical protein
MRVSWVPRKAREARRADRGRDLLRSEVCVPERNEPAEGEWSVGRFAGNLAQISTRNEQTPFESGKRPKNPKRFFGIMKKARHFI